MACDLLRRWLESDFLQAAREAAISHASASASLPGGAILSFHGVYRRCLSGRREEADAGWRSLLRFFLPITDHLVRQYFSSVWPDPADGSAALFGHLRANDAEPLRAYRGQAEKEFLMFLREELFALGRARRGESEPLGMTHEQFADLLNQFLPIPREAVVMLAKGYEPEKFAIVLHMEDATAREIQPRCNATLANWGLDLRLPVNLDRLLGHLEQQEATPECVPVRTFVRIKDGQITWNDKEAADRHLTRCLHCFQHYVTYQELHWFFVDDPPAEPRQVEAVALRMGLACERPAKKPSLLGRMFRGGAKSAP